MVLFHYCCRQSLGQSGNTFPVTGISTWAEHGTGLPLNEYGTRYNTDISSSVLTDVPVSDERDPRHWAGICRNTAAEAKNPEA